MVNAPNVFALTSQFELFPTELASPTEDSVLYMAFSSPLATVGEGNGILDYYEARRSSGGWETVRRLGPNGLESSRTIPGGATPDHSYAFMEVESLVGTLAGNGPISYVVNPDNTFELTGVGSLGTEPAAEGRYITEDGDHIIFTTGKSPSQSHNCAFSKECLVRRLEEDAPGGGAGVVYDRSANGPTHVISLLPPNVTPPDGEQAYYQGTSKDASSVAFTINGTLYVRVRNGEVGAETEEVAAAEPVFSGISREGRYLFYVTGGGTGTIHRFDTTDESDEELNASAPGEVVNISADGSHVYFISNKQIEGQGKEGFPNLYVWSEGGVAYVATVSLSDLERTSGDQNSFCAETKVCGAPALTRWTTDAVAPSQAPIERGPGADSSRATPDGKVLVFESKAKLTGYENANPAACPSWTAPGPDGVEGTADDIVLNEEGRCTEIYRYEEGKGLTCLSCNLGKPAGGDAHLQDLDLAPAPIVVNNLSTDGGRVFFETPESLVES
ncbi:MAG TPA: hypothetical protein VG448_00430, partial [Solirubrobacterales bacterium]|nr:hypothetical protein [Solirubrobacterales bacterium]